MSILASLARAYERLPDVPKPGYSTEKIGFLVSLHADGSVAHVIDLREGDGKKKQPRMMQVPQPAKRTVAVLPNLFWDKTSYALGVTAGEGRRTAEEHAAFKMRHRDLLAQTEDAGLLAFLRFLETWSPAQFQSPLWPDEMMDQNLVFGLEEDRRSGVFIHKRDAAIAIASYQSGDSEDSDICLVSGKTGPVARLHPAIKNVWGGQSSGGSIVSFNLDAFESYGHVQGTNAPVSELAAFKYSTALNSFLAGKTNRLQIGDASTVFWADASDADTAVLAEAMFGGAFGGEIDEKIEAGKVGAILKRMRDGVIWERALKEIDPGLNPGVRFHVLGLAPNAARISIRFWFEDDFGTLARNYQRFIADMSIEPPPREGYPPLWRYLVETAVLGKRENVLPNLAGDWIRAILTGSRYPLTLLSAVLGRIRADGEVNALRAGMLRAILVRNYGMATGQQEDKSKEAPVSLDPDNKNKGYLLGRLFASYEQVQWAALGRSVNATIKDKFYGSASASPRRVFALLEKGSANHLSKIGKLRPGQRVNLEKAIGSILESMAPDNDPFPAALPAEDQALFGLGYYHQRNEFFRKSDADPEEATP